MFKQDPEKPAVLYNHDNEYLHYQDDWYIIASKPDSYVVVYYKGTNDAWDGYGGAVVYTRARQLPQVWSCFLQPSMCSHAVLQHRA